MRLHVLAETCDHAVYLSLAVICVIADKQKTLGNKYFLRVSINFDSPDLL